jgi:hypothetical protein
MTTPRLFTFVLLFALALVAAPAVRAQEGTPPADTSSAPVDTSASSIVAEYDLEYDNVFKVVKAALLELGYPDNYASKKKRLIETGFRPMADQDNFFKTMSEYGEVPYIRSPGWTVGRAKLMVTFETLENGKVTVKVLAQLSGYEDSFTNIWHYWKSNGRLEQEAMDAINAAVDREKAAAGAAAPQGSN